MIPRGHPAICVGLGCPPEQLSYIVFHPEEDLACLHVVMVDPTSVIRKPNDIVQFRDQTHLDARPQPSAWPTPDVDERRRADDLLSLPATRTNASTRGGTTPASTHREPTILAR